MSPVTLGDCIRQIHSECRIEATALFGSSVRKNRELQQILSLTDGSSSAVQSPSRSELDLLLVTREKSLELLDLLKRRLTLYGDPIFHPSFYTVRSMSRLTFEIIALPIGSSWFSRNHLGRLVGLSILRAPNFLEFAGTSIADCIAMPPDTETREERLLVALHGHVGLFDMYSKLWAALGNGDRVDPFRVAKWLMCDTVWIETGMFYLDPDILVERFTTLFPDLANKHSELVQALTALGQGMSEADALRDDYELTRDLMLTFERSLSD